MDNSNATDEDVAAYQVAQALSRQPDMQAVNIPTFCPERHPHLGALCWIRGGAGAIFLRCGRQWWAWRVSSSIAGQLSGLHAEDTGPVRLMEFALLEPGNASLWRLFRSAPWSSGERDARRLGRMLRGWG